MKSLSFAVFAMFVATGCTAPVGEEASGETQSPDLALAAKTAAPKLNLSHIECLEDGTVLAHFVLLFAGSGTPGTLTGTYNGGTFSALPAKSSGNVWHYNAILPAGEIDILSATTTTSSGVVVTLHNPGEYAGNYVCGPVVPACPVVVEPQDIYCTSAPLGSERDECAHFGLVNEGKDDGLTGLSFTATMSAYVALVKSGSGGCGPGNTAYRVYVNVIAGQTLLTPEAQNISHVTYCACPPTL